MAMLRKNSGIVVSPKGVVGLGVPPKRERVENTRLTTANASANPKLINPILY
jgi:hypothetical protein